MLIFTEIILGASEALGSTAYNVLLSEHLDGNKHLSEWGINQMTGNLTVGISSVVSGFIVIYFGFPIMFFLMTSISLIAFVIFSLNFNEKKYKLILSVIYKYKIFLLGNI